MLRKLILSGLILAGCAQVMAGELKVDVGPLNPDESGRLGVLRVFLCDTQTCYEGMEKNSVPVHSSREVELSEMPSGNTEPLDIQSVVFGNVSAGDYAVVIHHDRDGDGKTDSNTCGLFGKPRDGVGFSNDVDPRKLWRKPRWEEVIVKVDGHGKDIAIRPLYMCDSASREKLARR